MHFIVGIIIYKHSKEYDLMYKSESLGEAPLDNLVIVYVLGLYNGIHVPKSRDQKWVDKHLLYYERLSKVTKELFLFYRLTLVQSSFNKRGAMYTKVVLRYNGIKM